MTALAVRALMRSPVVTITPHTPLPDIERVLREHGIRRVPVLDHRRLVGIVTLGDVRGTQPSDATTLSVYELGYLLNKVTAAQIMHTPVLSVAADAPVLEAAQRMPDHHISGLPVVADGQVVGMITESDVFRALVAGRLSSPTLTLPHAQPGAPPTTTGWPIV